ncbi:MAG: hypothetical protein OEY23_05690 [Acidimicrobiia bacterium]|nr:hypothetical protein [Acidimicrobiia bacterium]
MRTSALALAGVLLVAACGGAESAASRPPITLAEAAPAAAAAQGASPLPQVDVTEVATARTINLATLLPAEKPVLVWFWAPH